MSFTLHASDTALAFAGDPEALVSSFRAVELGWLGVIRTAGAGPDLQQGRMPPRLLGGEQVDALLEKVRLSSGGIDGLTLIAQVEPISSGPSTASGWWW